MMNKNFSTNNDLESRDPKEPSSLPFDMSITTTEVLPSTKGSASSKKTITPDQRPYMLGAALLQGGQAAAVTSPAEAVKSRARPKAKPLAAAPKEIRQAIRGETPPRHSPKKNHSHKDAQAMEADDEDDDELRLGGPSSKPSSSKDPLRKTSIKSSSAQVPPPKIIDIASEDDHEPITSVNKAKLPSKSKTAASKAEKKTKAARIDSETDEADESRNQPGGRATRFEDIDDEETWEQVFEINARESADDDDYDGKGAIYDKWGKGKGKAKKKTQARKSDRGRSVSKAPSEDPPARPSRAKRTTGRPSAVFAAAKRGQDGKASDTEGPDSEDSSLHVNSLRQASRTGQSDAVKESKGRTRALKGTSPRSKEFLNDEDMADDVPAAPSTKSSSNEKRNDSKATAVRTESNIPVSEAETAPKAPTSDSEAPTLKARPSKVYGKRANKPVPRLQDSEEEGEQEVVARESKVLLAAETADKSPQRKENATTGSCYRARSVSKGTTSSRSRRSSSPPFEVVIVNSAKKNRPPVSTKAAPRTVSKSKLAESVRNQDSSEASGEEDSDVPLKSSKKTSATTKASESSAKSSPKKKKPARIADSEEEEENEELEENDEKIAQPAKEPKAAKEREISPRKPLQEQKSILQPKDQNATALARTATSEMAAEAKSIPKPVLKGNAVLADVKPVITSTGKRRQSCY